MILMQLERSIATVVSIQLLLTLGGLRVVAVRLKDISGLGITGGGSGPTIVQLQEIPCFYGIGLSKNTTTFVHIHHEHSKSRAA